MFFSILIWSLYKCTCMMNFMMMMIFIPMMMLISDFLTLMKMIIFIALKFLIHRYQQTLSSILILTSCLQFNLLLNHFLDFRPHLITKLLEINFTIPILICTIKQFINKFIIRLFIQTIEQSLKFIFGYIPVFINVHGIKCTPKLL